ncbi:peptidase'insulinase-like peptidase' [Cryptosporidium sp. 43IA8]|nr:peptidase'insulinase-like peptidase' [Cryptosporidium sp. 43IA8]
MLKDYIIIYSLILLTLFSYFEFNSPLIVGVCISLLKSKNASFEGRYVNPNFIRIIDDEKFIKPAKSDKQFRYIKLKNELEVFLVSHNDTKVSSANIAVKVGSYMEPDSFPGLAHYLEHLLFINTEKYPELDGFNKLISLHNGYTNAYTEDTSTSYLFSIDSSSFEAALSMFSEFFKSPLFDENYVEKELMSIENEFNFRKDSLFFRFNHVTHELSDKRSLFGRFSYGNIETLKTIPESQGINLRDEVIKFYQKEYSSNRMVLALASNHTLDELTQFAYKYFSNIENKNLPVNSIKTPIQNGNLNPFNTMINQLVVIETLDDSRILKLIFPMKEYMVQHKNKVRTMYIDKLISFDRPGSLGHHLKSKKLILNMDFSIIDDNLGFTNAVIGFELTIDGEKNIGYILLSFFSAIKFASNNEFSKEIYDEWRKLLYISFKYEDPTSTFDQCKEIVTYYIQYECKPEDVLYSDYYMDEFDPNIYKEINSQLTPENLIITLERPDIEDLINMNQNNFNKSCNSISFMEFETVYYNHPKYGIEDLIYSNIVLDDIRIEKFSKAKFFTNKLNSCLLLLLSNITQNFSIEKYGQSLPTLNPYIPNDFSDNLNNVSDEKVPLRLSEVIKKYQVQYKNSSFKINNHEMGKYNNFFYYPNKSIVSPKSIIQFRFIFPLDKITDNFSEFSTDTVTFNLLFMLFLHIFGLVLTRNFFEILSATYSIEQDDVRFINDSSRTNQLILTTFGFSDHIEEITSELKSFIQNFSTYITNNDFELQKEKFLIDFKGHILNPTIYSELIEMNNKLFFNQDYSLETRLSRLETINFEEFIKFSEFYLNNYKLEGFILGNLNPLQSINIVNAISTTSSLENGNSSVISNYNLLSILSTGVNKSVKLLRLLYSSITGIFISMDHEDQDYLNVQEHLRPSPPLPMSNSIRDFQKLDPLSLKKGTKIYSYYLSKSKISVNSAIFLRVSIGYDYMKNYILTNILISIISEEFFTEIRTKKQLGYVVSAKYDIIVDHIYGINFNVVSSNKNIETLANNVLEFWDDWFYPDSNKITETLFNVAKESFIETLKEKIVNIKGLFSYFSREITTKTYDFDWKKNYIEYAEKLTYQYFLDWFKQIYDNSVLFMFAIQSPISEEKSVLDTLSNFVPQNFTKLTPSDSLFSIENIRTYNQWNVFNAI